MARADLMHYTLTYGAGEDGWVTRRELFRESGQFYLTNNAASEVRAKYGVDVEHKLIDGEHCYRLRGEGREPANGSPPDGPPFPRQPAAVAAPADPAVNDPLIPPLPGQLTLT